MNTYGLKKVENQKIIPTETTIIGGMQKKETRHIDGAYLIKKAKLGNMTLRVTAIIFTFLVKNNQI